MPPGHITNYGGNPITDFILGFMEDSAARDRRYEEKINRFEKRCNKFIAYWDEQQWHKDSHRPKLDAGPCQSQTTPGYKAVPYGNGALQKANSMESVMAFHEAEMAKNAPKL